MSKVSVIIPAYNQGIFLSQAVQSVLDQTYDNFEIIIVDDGSTDNTREISFSFEDERVKYIYQENRGLSGARNRGIMNTEGIYLSYLDSDDLFLPEKLELLVNSMENNPSLGLVAGQALPIDEHGNRVGKIFDKPLPSEGQKILLSNPLHVGSVLVKKTWQDQVGLFDESLRSYEDWDMWLRLAKAGCEMGWVPKPVSLYRFHSAQMTRDGTQMTAATFAVLDKTFSDPSLPDDWKAIEDEAYCNAYLRSAAQAYHAKDFQNAKASLQEALNRNPTLLDYDARSLADQFVAWTELPKVADPLTFLDDIYQNLPESLNVLKSRANKELGNVSVQLAFRAYQNQNLAESRKFLQKAISWDPSWLKNRGVISIFLRSLLPHNS